MINKVSSAKQKPSKLSNKRPGIDGQRLIIINAATAVLKEKNFDAVSVQDIIEKASVSRQTFYRCFKNKNDIYHEVYRIGNLFIRKSIENLNRENETAHIAASRIIKGIISRSQDDRNIVRSTYRETLRPESEFSIYREEILQLLIKNISMHVKKNQPKPSSIILIRAIVLAAEQLLFEFSALKRPNEKQCAEYTQALTILLKNVYPE